MTTHDDQIQTVTAIMRDTRIAVLTYVSQEGALVSTPMGTQDFEHPGTAWFLTERSSEKARALAADPRVNVAYSSDAGWVSPRPACSCRADPRMPTTSRCGSTRPRPSTGSRPAR